LLASPEEDGVRVVDGRVVPGELRDVERLLLISIDRFGVLNVLVDGELAHQVHRHFAKGYLLVLEEGLDLTDLLFHLGLALVELEAELLQSE